MNPLQGHCSFGALNHFTGTSSLSVYEYDARATRFAAWPRIHKSYDNRRQLAFHLPLRKLPFKTVSVKRPTLVVTTASRIATTRITKAALIMLPMRQILMFQ